MADYILYDGQYSGEQIDAFLSRVEQTAGNGPLQPELAGVQAKELPYGQYLTVTKQVEADGSITLIFGVPRGKDGADGYMGRDGTDGKSAYQTAVDGGYTGTEAEFAQMLGGVSQSASDAESAADRAKEWASKPPYIGANGNWWVYDASAGIFRDSGVDASITLSIADITMLPTGNDPFVTNTGTNTDPVFHLFIPLGATGNGIASATLNTDYTLTLTFTDGTSTRTGSIRGEPGPQGRKGDTGESGVISPVAGFYAMSVDADGNLWAHYATSEETPGFEYDAATGNLYAVIGDD